MRHYPSPLQRRSYLCSLSCHWSESMLYVLNGQKEHIRAFFVWTAWMWESIPILDHLGVMLQFLHLASIFVGVGVGVGVVAVFRYLRSCGTSPTPTSEHVSSKDFHPSYTNWWPWATVRTAEITSRNMYL